MAFADASRERLSGKYGKRGGKIMVCKVCGRAIANENANFCEYCGADLNGRGGNIGAGGYSGQANDGRYGGAYGANNSNYGGYAQNSYNNGSQGQGTVYSGQDNSLTGILTGTAGAAQAENSMTFLHWIVILLLPYIPIIGTFAYVILLFVWAFGRTASTTRKNWARATLVMLVVGIFFMSYMLGGMISDGSLAEMLNGLGMS